MRKIKTSMNYITNVYHKVWRAGYCDLQYIMRGVEPRFYNSGVYGWNCDIYDTDAGAITTGYRNMRGERIPDKLITLYEEKARGIIDNERDYNEMQKKLDALRADFFGDLNAL